MFAFTKLQRLKVSTKLSTVVGSALVALCVMGAIVVFAAREIQHLGHDLYAENKKFLSMEMDVTVGIERAIADVHSAPSELNLELLKAKQEHLQALLNDAKRILKENLAGNTAADVKASSTKTVVTIEAFESASKKVFEFAASFAQPEAIAALSSAVAPAEAAVQAALKEFREAAGRTNAEKAAVIETTTATITWIAVVVSI